ncbi:MAG: signal peptide peptidase SppA [Opitutaceae bacterium]|nr:signal peptide peptidase SppA [Opitutaceae bacterium]
MKEFFRSFFACLLALFLTVAMTGLFVLVLFGMLAAAGTPVANVPAGSVLVFDMSANIADAPSQGSSDELVAELTGGGGPRRLELRKVVDAIDAAATDERIKAIYLEGSFEPTNYGSGYGALLEVRAALERFRTSGKPVIAYLVAPSTREFLVASAASKVVLNPLGMVATPGLSAEVVYWGGMFKKYGIEVQVAKAGKYKSAGESFSQEHMSDAEREQLSEILKDVWGDYVGAVATARKLAPEALQTLVDTEALISAEKARESGLVDELADFSAVLDELKAITGQTKPGRTFTQVSLASYVTSRAPAPGSKSSGPEIAVVYAEGVIVDGEGSPQQVGGDRLARELRKLRTNDNVKAVVLRVNSPGGSAIASEVIRAELKLLAEQKPLVVSMGTVAASGGYWIATVGNRVFAQSNTITGSIGVIAIIPNISGLADRFAINVEGVKTGAHADIFSLMQPRSAESMQVIQRSVDNIYTKFLDRVVEARKLDRAVVEGLAEGRVWSGADALTHGLVDEIGGLREAIKAAAAEAQLDAYRVTDYPSARTFIEALMERLSNPGGTPLAARSGPAGEIRRIVADGLQLSGLLNDPTGVYALMPELITIK